MANVLLTLEQGGKLKADLSRSHLFSDQKDLYKIVSSSKQNKKELTGIHTKLDRSVIKSQSMF